ncbi:MNIO family bufferin maturase [Chitinimonas sp. PSY-7]|uniref:MNIO family bufferin maturase n=1 Tax=Chitinimonas sp. PSY-7 TaxID=3459088 RepID=UPI00404028CB
MPYPTLPHAAGIGLRLPHIRQVLAERPAIAWLEVHPENYFGGGANLAALTAIRADYPLSLHGVGLGIGSACGLDVQHLAKFRSLIERLEPASVSEHLCWNRTARECFNDLLPLPYSQAALDFMVTQVEQAQEALGRCLLIENLSSYIAFHDDAIPEGEFLAALAQRSGCGLLLDLNNLYVNQHNLGRDARVAINALPTDAVGEIHVAGFEEREDGLWLDTHGTPVREDVWDLLEFALHRFGPQPVLLERDTHLPPLAELLAEADRAQTILNKQGALV